MGLFSRRIGIFCALESIEKMRNINASSNKILMIIIIIMIII